MQLTRRPAFGRVAWAFAVLVSLLAAPAYAQVDPAGFRGPASVWAGAEYSNVHASFPYQSDSRLSGVSVFAEYHRDAWVGLAGSARFLDFGGFENETERSFLAGPQLRFFRRDRFQPFAEGLAGLATIHYPFAIGNANYFTIAPAGGVAYYLQHRWSVRAEYEYQFWLNSPGYSNQPDHPLRPNGFHLGVSYRVFR